MIDNLQYFDTRKVVYREKNLDNPNLTYIAFAPYPASTPLLSLEKNNYVASYYINLSNDTSQIEFYLRNYSTTIQSEVDKIVVYKSSVCPSA